MLRNRLSSGTLILLSLLWPQLAQSDDLPASRAVGELEVVHLFQGPMPTGVTVSHEGRIFVNFPRWGDDVEFTVAEIKAGQAVPYPSRALNQLNANKPSECLISIQSVVVDPDNRLWILDTGRIVFGKPLPKGPKLVGVDLKTNQPFRTITFPPDVVLPTTYLNDVRFDLRRGAGGVAFITDSASNGPNAIIVVDLETGESWRRLHNHPSTRPTPGFLPFVEGKPLKQRPPQGKEEFISIGADGIAIGSEGKRLYYCPLASRQLYSVAIDALLDRTRSDEEIAETIVDHGEKGASDGLESDAENRIYVTNYETNAICRRSSTGEFETLVHDRRVLWPDTLSLARDGYLYFTANQLHRQASFHRGDDQREKPYVLFRVKTDGHPILLKSNR